MKDCILFKKRENLLRHVITRRTSVRRGYLIEQGTHANKESLFANVTWLMRLPRRIQRMLLVMTIPVLTLIFTLTTTAESRAESCTERFGAACMSCDGTHCTAYDCRVRYGQNCMSCNTNECTAWDCSGKFGQNCMSCNANECTSWNCFGMFGSGCMSCNANECTACDTSSGYVFSNGSCVPKALLDPNCLSASGEYCSVCKEGYASAPEGCVPCSKYSSNCLTCSTAFDCTSCEEGYTLTPNGCVRDCGEGYILELGTCVPIHPACLSYGPDGVCGECKEGYMTGPGGCVACSDYFSGGNCTKCSGGSCNECTNGKFAQMGYCVDTCNSELGFIGKEGKCIDKSQGCGEGYQLEGNVCEKLPANCSEALGNACSKCNNGYLEKDGECIPSANGCGAGYKDMGGYCNRIRYTPAEAAPLLNDNDNFVVLTFKK